MAKTNPLDAFVAPRPSSFPSDFRLPPMPKLLDSVNSGVGLMKGFEAHDQALEQWRQNAEKSINERITQPSTTTTTTTPTAPAATPAPTQPAVTSVNGKAGAVVLTSDDIPQGETNLYLTDGGFMAEFDHSGFVRNYVPAADMVVVPGGKNLVVAGPFTVDGTLTVNGIMLFLSAP